VTKKDETPAPRKRGRPVSKILDKEKLKSDLESGLTQQEALKNQGIGYDRVNEKAKSDGELSQIIKQSPEDFRDKYVSGSGVKHRTISAFELNLASGHPATVLWAMENIVGFKQARQIEVHGEVNHIHTLDPAQRAERIKQLRAELETEIVDVAIEESTDDSK
jgi:hypothetical protein